MVDYAQHAIDLAQQERRKLVDASDDYPLLWGVRKEEEG
jgi:hypothetical protein